MIDSKGHNKEGREWTERDFYQNVGEYVYMKAVNILVEWILFYILSGFTYIIIAGKWWEKIKQFPILCLRLFSRLNVIMSQEYWKYQWRPS